MAAATLLDKIKKIKHFVPFAILIQLLSSYLTDILEKLIAPCVGY